MKRAILLSGGLDSTAVAYWSRPDLAITIDYGQVAAVSEVRASNAICEELQLAHRVIAVDLKALGSGPMIGGAQLDVATSTEWWPFRNQLLLTLAGAVALRENIDELILGTVASDTEHADGTEEFVQRVDALMRLQEGSIRVSAPALHLHTPELIRRSGVPLAVLGWCYSCNVSATPCMTCRGCRKQIHSLEASGFFSR